MMSPCSAACHAKLEIHTSPRLDSTTKPLQVCTHTHTHRSPPTNLSGRPICRSSSPMHATWETRGLEGCLNSSNGTILWALLGRRSTLKRKQDSKTSPNFSESSLEAAQAILTDAIASSAAGGRCAVLICPFHEPSRSWFPTETSFKSEWYHLP